MPTGYETFKKKGPIGYLTQKVKEGISQIGANRASVSASQDAYKQNKSLGQLPGQPNAMLAGKDFSTLTVQNAPQRAALAAADPPTAPVQPAATVRPPVNPATTSPRPAMAVPAPKAPVAPPAATTGPFGGVPDASDPAMVGSRVMQEQRSALLSAPTPSSTKTSAPVPPTSERDAQLAALRQSYLGTFSPTEEETTAQQQLGSVAAKIAADEASARSAYAQRVGAINEQATLQPFLTGRQRMASGELADQLAALQSSSEAQTLPLSARLAQLQADREAKKARGKAELEFATPKETDYQTVGEGQSVIDPATGEVIYQAPAKATAEKDAQVIGNSETGFYERQADGTYKQVVGPGAEATTEKAPITKEIDGKTFQWNADTQAWETPKTSSSGSPADAAAIETLQNKVKIIDDLMTSPGLAGSVGPYGVARWTPFTADAAARQDFAAGVQQLIAKDTMDVLLNLKKQGGTLGALSDQERILLQSAASKIGTWMQRDENNMPNGKFAISEDLFKKELQTIRDLTETALQRAVGSSGQQPGVQNGVITDPNAFLDSF